MALTSPCTVRIAKPASQSFGEAMREHRLWLDSNKIQPIAFRPDFYQGLIGFEIGFKSEHDAALFDREFG
jgi:hypothetical protein